jgi:hypothetical protein
MNEEYLNDPVINELLDEVEHLSKRIIVARELSNYTTISYCLGMLYAVCQKIYERNAEIAKGNNDN